VHTPGGIIGPTKGDTSVLATEWSFGSVIWTMLVFFFWIMAIWIFIAVFGDIFRRNDISGWAKAGWILLIFVIPFLGALIYLGVRPKMTDQDREMMMKAQEQQRRLEGYSAADEVAKLTKLRDSGAITAEEFEEQKRRAMA
jgi:hypothetical protein